MSNKKLPYGYGLAFPTLLGLYIRKLNLKKWSFSLWVAAFLMMSLYSSVTNAGASHGPINLRDDLFVSLFYFLIGCPGFLFVYRKEAIGRFGLIRGRFAVFIGILMMLMFWGSALYYLYLGLRTGI